MHLRTPSVLVLTAAMIAATTSVTVGNVAAIDVIDDELAAGTFTGTIAIDGGFTLALGDSEVRFTVDLAGPAQLTVPAEGELSGQWDYTGSGSSAGTMSSGGFSVPISTTSTYIGTGGFAGTRNAPRLVGTNDVTSTGTFMGISQTTTEVQSINFAFHNVMAGCSQVVASFDQTVNNNIDQLPGGNGMFRGIIAVYDDLPDDSIETVEATVDRVSSILGNDGPLIVVLVEALLVLDEIEALQDELLRDDCPVEDRFFNMLTDAARDLLDRAFAELTTAQANDPTEAALTAAALPQLIRLGLGTGAMGSGSGGSGAALDSAARALAQDAYSTVLSEEHFDFDAAGRLAALSYQMGWDLEAPSDLTDLDIAITAGVET